MPLVIVSHDREFLDQLCTKVVETERGVSQTFRGNYTAYVKAKDERIAQQWAAWEKQQKEIARLVRPPDPAYIEQSRLVNLTVQRLTASAG